MKLNIHYFAGFFDGEGCISVTNPKRGVRVVLTNTNLHVLKAFVDYFKLGKISMKKRTEKDKYNKICYMWICWNRDAEKFLQEITPFLVIKKREGELALEYSATMAKHGRIKGQLVTQGLPQAVIDKRWVLISMMKEAKWGYV